MNLKYEITLENLKTLEIKQIALNKDKFGALTFDKAYPLLHKLRKMLVEFEELGYKDLLTLDEVTEIDAASKRLLTYVQRIHDLNPETDATFNINVRDSLETEVENFYRNTTKALRNYLVFLRQEAARKSQDQQALAEEQRAASQARKQAEEMLEQLSSKLGELNERKKQLETTSGEVGAQALASHFKRETVQYEKLVRWWFRAAIGAYVIIVLFIIGIAAYYTFFASGGWESVSIPEGVAKLVLFTALWYALSFTLRNYKVNSHLAAVNRHRAAVASTLEDFLAANPAHAGEILQNGTDAMFRHVAVGFITKAEKGADNPLLEIINPIVNPKGE